MPVGASVLGNLLMSACLIALFTDIAGGLLNASLPFFASARLRNVTELSSIFSLLMAVAWGLMLAAVWRGATSSAYDLHRESVSR